MTTNERTPSWMDEKNDSLHASESESLLFGSGHVNLRDDDDDVEHGKQYGSTNDDSDEDREEERSFAALSEPDSESDSPINPKSKPPRGSPKASPRGAPKPSPKEQQQKKKKKKQRRRVTREEILASAARPHMPRQNACLWMFHFINGCAVVSSLAIVTAQIIPLVRKPHRISSLFALLNLFLKFYIVLFCVVFLLVETHVPLSVIRDAPLLQAYLSRGFLYSFLGLISTVEAYSGRVQSYLDSSTPQVDHAISWDEIFTQVSAWLMCTVGVVYMAMGACCLKHLHDRMRQREKEEWQEYREALREWKQLHQ